MKNLISILLAMLSLSTNAHSGLANQIDPLDYYQNFFTQELNECKEDSIIRHRFLNAQPMKIYVRSLKREIILTSELYLHSDGSYEMLFQEDSSIHEAKSEDVVPVSEFRKVGVWHINDRNQLVLANLGYLEPTFGFESTSVRFTFTKVILTAEIIGKSMALENRNDMSSFWSKLKFCPETDE